jgi:hypothetical protein
MTRYRPDITGMHLIVVVPAPRLCRSPHFGFVTPLSTKLFPTFNDNNFKQLFTEVEGNSARIYSPRQNRANYIERVF